MNISEYLNPMLLCDFYKISHREQYPDKTMFIYSTWTPRKSLLPYVNEVVVFGVQAFVKGFLVDYFNKYFFNVDFEKIKDDYCATLRDCLGIQKPDYSHIQKLHTLGYLPIEIKCLPEGYKVSIRTPVLTIMNTDPNFFWLTNYLETLMSCELWQPMTVASIAYSFRKLLNKNAIETVGDDSFCKFQGHDFSMRGISSLSSALSTGAAHLLSFSGTDTIPSIHWAKYFYGGEIEAFSVPATEHSIQCTYEDDFYYFSRMINDIYPQGIVSIVSDGYDFWKVLTDVLPSLREDILKRNGKLVIRPDSGDPVKILCGDPESSIEIIKKGSVQALWDLFGGTISKQGFKVLDSHIGIIYGDAINYDRLNKICEKLKEKGFATTNCVFGIGSFTYQYNTRDTLGFALKTTAAIIDGKEKYIFKKPITDDGTKYSQKGFVKPYFQNNAICWQDGLSLEESKSEDSLYKSVFCNGKVGNFLSFDAIKKNIYSR